MKTDTEEQIFLGIYVDASEKIRNIIADFYSGENEDLFVKYHENKNSEKDYCSVAIETIEKISSTISRYMPIKAPEIEGIYEKDEINRIIDERLKLDYAYMIFRQSTGRFPDKNGSDEEEFKKCLSMVR